MKRKIFAELVKWKHEENGRTALLVEGARRVGKSYRIEKFAKADTRVMSWLISIVPVKLVWICLNITWMIWKRWLSSMRCSFSESTGGSQISRRRWPIWLHRNGIADEHKETCSEYCHSFGRTTPFPVPDGFWRILGALGNETLMDLIRRCFIDTKSMGQAMHRKAMD